MITLLFYLIKSEKLNGGAELRMTKSVIVNKMLKNVKYFVTNRSFTLARNIILLFMIF
jgi:hypothetical protein